MKKQLLSLSTIVVFIVLALASKVNKIHYNAFNYSNRVEEKSGAFVELEDGQKMYGKKVTWKSGLLTKDQVKLDDVKFPLKEVKGYHDGSTYYIRKGKEFIQRIVRGKINVYVEFTQVTQTSTDRNGFSRTRTYTRTDHYAQIGDDGPLVGIAGQKDIIKLVSSCPLAVEMADLSNKKMRRAIKSDHNYLNSIFEVYNNGCKRSK